MTDVVLLNSGVNSEPVLASLPLGRDRYHPNGQDYYGDSAIGWPLGDGTSSSAVYTVPSQ